MDILESDESALIARPKFREHAINCTTASSHRQVLQLVAHGDRNTQIATEVSEATVKVYLGGIFERLKVAGRAEAIAVGLRLGLLDPTSGPKAPEQAPTKWVTP